MRKRIVQTEEPIEEPAGVAVTVEIPLVPLREEEYVPRRVTLPLSPRRGCVGQRLAGALALCGATVDGRPVRSVEDAVRWVLDQVADQVEERA